MLSDRLVLLGFNPRGLSIYCQVGELVGKEFFEYLEFGITLCVVKYLEGEK